MLRSGGSYESASELVLTFGLGGAVAADAIEVKWPSGVTDGVKNVAADQIITLKEAAGLVGAQKLNRK